LSSPAISPIVSPQPYPSLPYPTYQVPYDPNNTTLFVGGLSSQVSEEDLAKYTYNLKKRIFSIRRDTLCENPSTDGLRICFLSVSSAG
jgi:hypothetical protein